MQPLSWVLVPAARCRADRAPDALGCGRHVEMLDAERGEGVENRVDDGLRRGDAAGLARSLAAEGLDRRRLPGERHVERRQSPVRGTA